MPAAHPMDIYEDEDREANRLDDDGRERGDEPQAVLCERCGGRGEIVYRFGGMEGEIDCPDCHGIGVK